MLRKVRQLDNDVEAIYGLLEGITESQQKHSTALADLSVAITGVRATQQRQYNRLDEMDARVEGLQAGVTDVKATLSRYGGRLDNFDARFDGLEEKVDGLSAKLDRVLDRLLSGASSSDG
jgi:chromosome segregation ATPase